MRVENLDGELVFVHKSDVGKEIKTSLTPLVLELSDWNIFTDHMISYCNGKAVSTRTTWIGRINLALPSVIKSLGIKQLPSNSQDWQAFIKQWYADTITTKDSKSSIETRVSTWNRSIKPFLEFMQVRDTIPIDVIVPKMRRVGEVQANSSFKVSLIGESPPQKVNSQLYNETNERRNLLTPISLSRTDAEYLDEVRFELERKRAHLLRCLTDYWNTVKTFHDFGKKIISTFEHEHSDLVARIISGDVYDYVQREGKVPPLRHHIAIPNDRTSFELYLFTISSRLDGLYKPSKLTSVNLPRKRMATCEKEFGDDYFFPKTFLENDEYIDTVDKINWCMGIYTPRDIAYFIALLMMLNPKFNYQPLLSSKVVDKDGKLMLEVSDIGFKYSIDKPRAKSIKKEELDEVSLEIIQTLIQCNTLRAGLIDKNISKNLFLSVNHTRTGLTSLAHSTVSAHLTGYNKKHSENKEDPYDGICLSHYFPSLLKVGLGPNTISHSKIRATEGVLEWFRTGSVRATSRKLGNTKKVVLENYIPKELITAFSTRLVRRIQNVIIVSATYNEDYLLDAVDFESLTEVHEFIDKILSFDKKASSPLVSYLKNISKRNSDIEFSGNLITSISSTTLTALYLYRESALKSNVEMSVLTEIESNSGISPLALITLANYLMLVLPNNKDNLIREANIQALDKSKRLLPEVNWDGIFIKREKMI